MQLEEKLRGANLELSQVSAHDRGSTDERGPTLCLPGLLVLSDKTQPKPVSDTAGNQ